MNEQQTIEEEFKKLKIKPQKAVSQYSVNPFTLIREYDVINIFSARFLLSFVYAMFKYI